MKSRKLIAYCGIAASIYIGTTFVADFVVGPLVSKVITISPQTGNHPWGILVPFLIQNGLVCLGFALARKQLFRAMGEASFYYLWLINASTCCAISLGYIVLVTPGLPAPVTYRMLGGDAARAIWSITVLVSATLPLSTYFQLRFSTGSAYP